MRIETGAGQYIDIDITPRHTAGKRNIEASVGVYTGPAGHRARFYDADALTEAGWALLTAAHQLRRLQGPPASNEPDPQTTIFDALAGAL